MPVTKYMPTACVKCGSTIPRFRGVRGRRRIAVRAVKRSAEADMVRLQSNLRTYEKGLAWDRLNRYPTQQREAVMAELQARFGHLADVPLQG
jgi:hypothetical protein